MLPRLLDSHAHLDAELGSEGIHDQLERARSAGVATVVAIGGGDGLAYARHAVAVAERYPQVWATVALHPHEARRLDPPMLDALRGLCAHPRVVAVGEIGLDFHYNFSPPEAQEEGMRAFCRLAREVDLPLVLHVRDAHERAQQILAEEEAGEVGGVVHCFTSGPEDAARYLDLGFHISIPGVVTFKNAEPLREAVRRIPGDRLLIETDSPYLAPVPKRGKTNEPAFLVYTAQKVAELRGRTLAEIGKLTEDNAIRLFGLSPVPAG